MDAVTQSWEKLGKLTFMDRVGKGCCHPPPRHWTESVRRKGSGKDPV